jgi:hypothetical protein
LRRALFLGAASRRLLGFATLIPKAADHLAVADDNQNVAGLNEIRRARMEFHLAGIAVDDADHDGVELLTERTAGERLAIEGGAFGHVDLFNL